MRPPGSMKASYSGRHVRRPSSGVRLALALLIAPPRWYGVAPMTAAKPKPGAVKPGGAKQSPPKDAGTKSQEDSARDRRRRS